MKLVTVVFELFAKVCAYHAPPGFVFQEQSYSSLHSRRSLAWGHFRGHIDDPCGVIVDPCGYRRFLRCVP